MSPDALLDISDLCPAENHSEFAEALTKQYHRATGGMIEVLKFGAMMMALEVAVDSARGVNSATRGPGTKGTGAKAWLRTYAPEVKEGTAYRLKAVAESVEREYAQIVGVKVAKEFTLAALVITPAEELPAAAQAKQLDLFNYVAGTSQRSWLDKAMGRHGHAIKQGNAGFHPNALILRAWLAENYPQQPELQGQMFCDLPGDIQARFKKEGTRYKERLSKEQKAELALAEKARGWNESFAPTLLDAIGEGLYARADDEQLAAQKAALSDYLDKVEEQIRERAKRAKAPGTTKALAAR